MNSIYSNKKFLKKILTGILFLSLSHATLAQTWKKQNTATLPLVTASSTCNATRDTVGLSADRSTLLICQSGVWMKSASGGGMPDCSDPLMGFPQIAGNAYATGASCMQGGKPIPYAAAVMCANPLFNSGVVPQGTLCTGNNGGRYRYGGNDGMAFFVSDLKSDHAYIYSSYPYVIDFFYNCGANATPVTVVQLQIMSANAAAFGTPSISSVHGSVYKINQYYNYFYIKAWSVVSDDNLQLGSDAFGLADGNPVYPYYCVARN